MSAENSWVGIDVAKNSLEVSLLPTGARLAESNDRDGVRRLLAALPPVGQCLVVVEATGGYQRLVVAELIAAGHRTAVVNPRQVRDFARGLGLLAKTDRLDAEVIARFGQQAQPRATQPESPMHQRLQELVARRRQLVELRAAEACRLETASTKAVIKSVRTVIEQLGKLVRKIEKELSDLVESDDQLQCRAWWLSPRSPNARRDPHRSRHVFTQSTPHPSQSPNFAARGNRAQSPVAFERAFPYNEQKYKVTHSR